MVDEGYFTGDLALTFWLLLGAVEVLRRDDATKGAAPPTGSHLPPTRQVTPAPAAAVF
jgi:hypothetical protein